MTLEGLWAFLDSRLSDAEQRDVEILRRAFEGRTPHEVHIAFAHLCDHVGHGFHLNQAKRLFGEAMEQLADHLADREHR